MFRVGFGLICLSGILSAAFCLGTLCYSNLQCELLRSLGCNDVHVGCLQVQSIDSYNDFCTRMLESCFNYVASFAQSQAQMTPNPSEQFVPLSTLRQWFDSFQRRFQQNPDFWKS